MFTTTQTYSDIWQTCLSRIRKETTDEEFNKWFEPIVPLNFDGTTLQLRVPNESYVYHIEKHYIPFLRPIIYQLFGQKTKLRYSIPSAEQLQQMIAAKENGRADATSQGYFRTQNDSANVKNFNPFVIPGIKKLVIDPQLNPNYTFDTFIEGDCNRMARSAGLAIAISPGKTPYNPLYIYGKSGLGKTHVVQAIGTEIRQRHPELQVLYVSMNKFQAQYTTAVINKEVNDFIHFYQTIDVLIIDDIQELSGNKEGTQNIFFNIFNHLQMSFKQLILTSDKLPIEMKDIDERLITRFKWGLATELSQPDKATRDKIVRSKAERLGIDLSDEVVDFMSDNITANVREIEGALSSLVANSAFMNRKINTSLARDVLKIYVKEHQKEITIDLIQKVVCDYYNIDIQKLNSPKRTREIALARQVAMYLAKTHTSLPLTTIGATIGGKNHATVLYAFKTVSNFIETDKSFRFTMEELERKLLTR